MDEEKSAAIAGPKSKEDIDDEYDHPRKGNTITAAAHIITAVIGAGVLALPYSVANFGWGGGPPMILMFGAVSLYSSMLLADLYRYPGPDEGKRNPTYMHCVRSFLGPHQVWFCGLIQYLVLVIIGVGYNVVASISMAAIRRSDCFHGGYSCKPDLWQYCIIFGACQIVFSQIPNLSQATALSVVAAIMSLTYATIGLGLSIGKATEHTHSHGTAGGVSIASEGPAAKAYLIFASLGQTAFAFIYSFVLIEIQGHSESAAF
ncbi:hypothetical protein WJX84_012215 [Apatococcus fuscideae]|uniref:Amino acid transporter transmembrane domain-containing protein n=1 Tax=Apatococcus fuscideae TaxID=2026836 RepID=A0AAW1RGI1_9CHLO